MRAIKGSCLCRQLIQIKAIIIMYVNWQLLSYFEKFLYYTCICEYNIVCHTRSSFITPIFRAIPHRNQVKYYATMLQTVFIECVHFISRLQRSYHE